MALPNLDTAFFVFSYIHVVEHYIPLCIYLSLLHHLCQCIGDYRLPRNRIR